MPKKSENPEAGRPAAAVELRDACVLAAWDVIAERGIENLSMRDVARKLGVSHQAPYRHYPSRDHLLAEVMRRCFERFAADLDARPRYDDPRKDLESLGLQYLAFARQHPLEYRLMFSTPWPVSAEHPGLVRDAAHAFDILRKVLRRMAVETPPEAGQADLDALFIWSAMHGLAGVMNGECIDKINIEPQLLENATAHIMQRVGRGLTPPGDRPPP